MPLRRQLRLLTVATYVTLALTAGTLALALMSAAQALGIQPWAANDWWALLLPDSGDVGFLITFAGMTQATVFYLRRTTAWRVKALDGNMEAMPLALPELVVGKSGETVAAAPATLRWRLTAYGRRVWLVPWGLLGAFVMLGGGAFLAIQIAFVNPWLAPSDPFEMVNYAAGSAFIIAGFAMWVMAARQGLRGPDGVSADSAGITRWTRHGLGETILWGDARLLEANWMAGARGQPWPQIRVYRADGTSIGWPMFPAPQPGEERRYELLEMSESEAAEAARTLLRLASASSGLPVRTAERSLADPSHKWGQWLLGAAQSLAGYLYMVLIVAALGVGVLAFHEVAAPWLNIAAAVGLALCAARLAYFHARNALVIPESWDDKDDETQRPALLWPALLAVSGAGALVVSVSALIAGHAPASWWTDTEVVAGSALMLLGGAAIFWART